MTRAAPSPRWELLGMMCLAALAFVAIPLSVGMGLSWDALNHHFYLGWSADSPRFDQDYLAAAYQSFQYPYLYWPFYRLGQAGVSGWTAGVVLDGMYLAAVPAVWLVARVCVPEASWWGLAMRACAVALAFTTNLVLSMFDTTANDLLAAVPLVWAVALGLQGALEDGQARARKLAVASGLFAGVSVAFKLSNGPLVLVLPVLWAWASGNPRQRLLRMAAGGVATLAAFAVCYGYWGWQLWSHFGNPVYPFADDWFAPVRSWVGRP